MARVKFANDKTAVRRCVAMKIGLFGGTFNPIHLGHLLMAESARQTLKLDRVIFLPAGAPPHKNAPHTAAQHRLAMVRLAIQSNKAFELSDWEVRQKRTVYTKEALLHFRDRYPRAELFFILGTDSLAELPTWRNGSSLLSLATFAAVDRPEKSWREVPRGIRRHCVHVNSPAVPFASRDLRDQILKGQSIRYQVLETIERYIARHRLYRQQEKS